MFFTEQHAWTGWWQGLDLPQWQTFAPVQGQRPGCDSPLAQQQLFDCSSFSERVAAIEQPHVAVGKPCTGIATAASQINVRAAM